MQRKRIFTLLALPSVGNVHSCCNFFNFWCTDKLCTWARLKFAKYQESYYNKDDIQWQYWVNPKGQSGQYGREYGLLMFFHKNYINKIKIKLWVWFGLQFLSSAIMHEILAHWNEEWCVWEQGHKNACLVSFTIPIIRMLTRLAIFPSSLCTEYWLWPRQRKPSWLLSLRTLYSEWLTRERLLCVSASQAAAQRGLWR